MSSPSTPAVNGPTLVHVAVQSEATQSEEDPTEFAARYHAARRSNLPEASPMPLTPPTPLFTHNTPVNGFRIPVPTDMSSNSPAVNEGTLISFGVPLEDSAAKRITIRVILLAAATCAVSIVHFILNLLRGNYDSPEGGDSNSGVWSQLSALLIELSIPVSGYMGALYHNRQLTCCYCSCNLFLAVISVMSFARFQIRLLEVNGQCYLETDPSQRSLCLLWQENSFDKWVFLFNILMTSGMACCAFFAGNLLYHKLAQEGEFPDLSTAPVVGEVVQLSAAFTSTSPSQPHGSNNQVRMVTYFAVDSHYRAPAREDLTNKVVFVAISGQPRIGGLASLNPDVASPSALEQGLDPEWTDSGQAKEEGPHQSGRDIEAPN
ncbi:unnamed protein product [Symbiodinium natans]|uniref:Transmembrane protein n=1 Tax=Symbiodinium natans TaxID=878477 RepID=A0A812MFI5_9DINO|nr:unnamed protein product [Symbiodinium natans]